MMMVSLLKDQIYDYFTTHTDNLDLDKLKSAMATIGYGDETKEPVEICREAIFKKVHEKQIAYIEKLINAFGEKIIFMKGIFTSQDLYGDIHERKSSDIDIIVKKCDVMEIGWYLLKEDFICDTDEEKWLERIRENHLVFSKRVSNLYPVQIEVHGSVFNPPYYYPQFTDYVWNRAVHQKLLGMEPLLMDPYDRVIHYAVHFCIHHLCMEMCALMNLRSTFMLQPLLDIYCTVKKYDIDFEVLLNRIEEMGAVWETYDVVQRIFDIFPDFCPETFVCDLKERALMKDNPYFERGVFPLLQSVRHYFSKDYSAWLTRFIKYDPKRVEQLDEEGKQLFHHECEDFEVVCEGCKKNTLEFLLKFKLLREERLGELMIRVHYHMDCFPEEWYLKRFDVSFNEENGRCVCQFYNDVSDEKFDWKYEMEKSGDETVLKVYIPCETFENEVIMYSVNFIDTSLFNVCVSGEQWDDFETMRGVLLQ